ncbi:hypothetical protein K0M31_007995 [Melipona bicolor]|uniref:Uncharacterized protein n=1 Tax=Melipona bicolor TaxID=60889 RepID=A0AA40KWB9_9HYME|nr:hypothetical protein K0M31_007995 [Melipona bicolor]
MENRLMSTDGKTTSSSFGKVISATKISSRECPIKTEVPKTGVVRNFKNSGDFT